MAIMDALEKRSGQDRREQNLPVTAERRSGPGRRLTDQDYRVMLETERKRWEADMNAGQKSRFHGAWEKHLTSLREIDALAETDPAQAAKVLKQIRSDLAEVVENIKNEKGESVINNK